MLGIVFQNVCELLQRYTRAPFAVDDMNIKPEALTHINPQMTELPEPRRQHFVAGRQGIGQRGFPASCARRGENKRRAIFTAENILQTGHDGMGQVREIGRTVILH